MKQRTESDPFISLNLRAFIEAKDPYEQAAVTALVFWHWWKGNNEGLGVEGLAALGKMSPAKAKAVAADLKARGWIETSRKFGAKTEYRLTVEKMTFKEAYTEAIKWLPQSQLDSDQLALWQPTSGSVEADKEPPQSQPNSKRSDYNPQTKNPDLAPKGATVRHPEQDAFWDHVKTTWIAKHHSEPEWPRIKGFQTRLTSILERLGLDETKRRWDNLQADPWTNKKTLITFTFDVDAWITRRDKPTGGASARAFHQPDTDWQPSQR